MFRATNVKPDGGTEDADAVHDCCARQQCGILPTSVKTDAFCDFKNTTTCA